MNATALAGAPPPRELAFDAGAVAYAAYLASPEGRRRASEERRLLQQHARGGGPALDAGGGFGALADALLERGRRVVLLERSAAMIDLARRRARRRARERRPLLVRGDLRAPPFRRGAFGLVLCHHVLEYAPAWRGALRALCALVAPAGAISVAALEAGRRGDRRRDRVFGLPRRGLALASVREAVARAGFAAVGRGGSGRHLHVVARRAE